MGSNVLLGHEPHRFGIIDRPALYRRAAKVLERVGGDIDPHTPLRSAVARAEAADGDRARAFAGREGAAARRADRHPERDGRRAPVRPASRPAQERDRDGLHFAPPARGPGDHRPRGLHARRRAGGRVCRRAKRRSTSWSSWLAGATRVSEAAPPTQRPEVVMSVRGPRLVRPARRRDSGPGRAGRRRPQQRAARAVRGRVLARWRSPSAASRCRSARRATRWRPAWRWSRKSAARRG